MNAANRKNYAANTKNNIYLGQKYEIKNIFLI